MLRLAHRGLVLAAVLLVAPLARADVIPPDVETCRDQPAGAACDADGKPGRCQATTCSRLDYSKGTPPTSASYACVRCMPAAAPDKPAAPDQPPATPEAPVKPTAKRTGCATSGTGGGATALGCLLLVFARRRRAPRA